MMRKILPELGRAVLLLLLPLLIFAPIALGSRTLVPADILYAHEPHRAAAGDTFDDFHIAHPQNHLVADLVLQNYAWKQFILDAVRDRQLPLWDPYIFVGHPFLANGQHSALYPLSAIFYVMPLWRAYGVFAWLQLGLAGCFAYLFVRVLGGRHLGGRRLGGLIAGITFQFCGFMVISAVPHPMIVAGASWLPFILAMVELVIQQRSLVGERPTTLPWALLGAVGLGCQMLVGHVENTYFLLLVSGAYTVWRLGYQWLRARRCANRPHLARPIFWLALLFILGLALGAVQFVPMWEVTHDSFRSGEAAASLEQVRGWAYPPRRVIAFGVPNFFGNPAHHRYFDLFTGRWTPAPDRGDGQYIDWGMKNYVEGAAYLGLLPLFLSLIAVLHPFTDAPVDRLSRILIRWFRRPYVPFFTLLALFSLGCIFGTPIYALVYALPGLEQSHSPFRWVFPLSLAVTVLTAFGVEALVESRERLLGGDGKPQARGFLARLFLLDAAPSVATVCASLVFWGGAATLLGLALSRAFFPQIEPLAARAFQSLAKAPEAFPDHRAFYSYEFWWVALFGLLLTGTGIILRVSRCPIYLRGRPVWEYLAVGLLLLDLVSFGRGFAPAVDPALLAYTPPSVAFLQAQQSEIGAGDWRYATFTPPGTTKTLNANVGMFYRLPTVNGYDSLFSRQYADYMGLIEPQNERLYNRISSFREWSSLDSPLTDLLNVKYVVTEVEIPNPKYALVYRDEAVRIYENLAVMPRAYTLPRSAAMATDDFGDTVQRYDPRRYVILDAGGGVRGEAFTTTENPQPAEPAPQTVTGYTINQVKVSVQTGEPSWLALADTYFPGWKAFVRPAGAGEDAETEVEIYRVNGNFRGVFLEEPGTWTVRFKYSPDSVKVGAFVSFIAGMTVLFLAGLYLWRFFYRAGDDASTVQRVAKNSIAPIVLNLFNRTIDLAFAALMARILGPVGNGQYAWAVNVYLWFDIVANFGLDMYLVREAAREPACARNVFFNTTILRLFLFAAAAPALGGFLLAWQGIDGALNAPTIWALALLYLGLLPGTIANGLTALFRACEKHEFPAAIQTVTTIIKVTLGVLALVGGFGFVGVAGATILTNAATMTILAILARRWLWAGPARLPEGPVRLQRPLLREMLAVSWPLMLSLLLQVLFPGVNVLLLKPLQGDAAVGWYDAGYKWISALNIIPAFFTVAVFPVMSRQAAQNRAGLMTSYRLSSKLLTMISLPAAVLITLLADVLVGVLSGGQFLPHGAIALQILVWSVVFGWLNSLTNYVLIALDRQRYVLLASGVRVLFAVAANLLFVRQFGYVASAGVIVAGEALLFALFDADLRRQLGAVGWGRLLWRTGLAALLMGGVVAGVAAFNPALALLSGLFVYPPALFLLRAITPAEWAALAPLLPARLRRWVSA